MDLELFAGAGGFTWGSHLIGRTSVGIEWDASACTTRRIAGWPTMQADTRHQHATDFPDAEILTGGPPCQTFSATGTGMGRMEMAAVLDGIKRMAAMETVAAGTFSDDRTGLVLEPLRFILEADEAGHPYQGIVLEQVPAVLPIWDAYADALRQLEYSVATGILRTEQYGVPQTRRRAVLVARLDGPAELPAPTHRPYRKGVRQDEGDLSLLPWLSMADVLPHRTGPWSVISNYGTGGDPKNRGRRRHDEPAATVTGKVSRNRIVSPDGAELERFSHAEAGVLQGFPASWPWTGRDIPQLIGNACPPPLAAALISAVTAA
jgi:DNA (cytosine-5)-methyltransferase 1